MSLVYKVLCDQLVALTYGWLIHSLSSFCDSFHTLCHRLGGSAYRICGERLRKDITFNILNYPEDEQLFTTSRFVVIIFLIANKKQIFKMIIYRYIIIVIS